MNNMSKLDDEQRTMLQHIRHAVRVLATIGELHKRGYQRLRVMPFMSPSGAACDVGSAQANFFTEITALFFAKQRLPMMNRKREQLSRATRQGRNLTSGGRTPKRTMPVLADKFLKRFCAVAQSGQGWDYPYAGWYQRLLWHTEAGWLPVVMQDCVEVSYEHIPLQDFRPSKRRVDHERRPMLPLPPPGELQQDYGG